jgi:GntR family transcriptional regulator/MocR family aminotransferase
MELANIWSGTIEQLALARLLEERLLDKHIYRTKKLYEAKRRLLIHCLQQEFGEQVTISGENAGMHLLASFDRPFIHEDFHRFTELSVEVDGVENFALTKGSHCHQLVLGYGNLTEQQIHEGVLRLKRALDNPETV